MDQLLPIAEQIGTKLIERAETIGISESSSGGLISAALLAIPGASRFYRGGGIIYTPQAFRGLMHLGREDLGGARSATEPYALLMARTIRARVDATWGLCETGASGPDGNAYGDAAGHTCIGLCGGNNDTYSEVARTLETGRSDRPANMYSFAAAALDLLHESLS
ncbi:MAG: CinA family protein [Pseudomonadota bacterium]